MLSCLAVRQVIPLIDLGVGYGFECRALIGHSVRSSVLVTRSILRSLGTEIISSAGDAVRVTTGEDDEICSRVRNGDHGLPTAGPVPP